MDLNEVAIFVRVVRARSFTTAARQLGLPKSTVSRSVSRLEQDLGVRLLQRTTRKLALTDAGAAYYEQVAPAIAAVHYAGERVAEMQEQPQGTLRITAPTDMGASVLADVVARFVERYPSLRVDVVLTGRLVDLIEEGFDLAIRAGPLRDSSLVVRRLGTGEFRLFAAPSYLERHGMPASVDELERRECVLFRPQNGVAVWELEGPEMRRRVEVKGHIGVDDFSFVQAAVMAGAGVGLLPTFTGAREVGRGRLLPVLPEYRVPGAPVSIVYPSARHLPPKVALFRDFAAELLAGQLS